jgi:hypothetical protein
MSIAELVRKERPDGPISIVGVGPRSSTIALASAALDPEIAAVTLHNPLGSLKELIEEKKSFTESPELFCFGLLKDFDISTIAELVAPRPIHLVDQSARAGQEFAALKPFYEKLGAGSAAP